MSDQEKADALKWKGLWPIAAISFFDEGQLIEKGPAADTGPNPREG